MLALRRMCSVLCVPCGKSCSRCSRLNNVMAFKNGVHNMQKASGNEATSKQQTKHVTR